MPGTHIKKFYVEPSCVREWVDAKFYEVYIFIGDIQKLEM